MKFLRLFSNYLDKYLYKHLYEARHSWLKQSRNIPTHLTAREKDLLFRLARSRSAGNLVEIGSYLGASSCALAAGIADNDGQGHLYCIDTWGNDAMTEGKKDTMGEFATNTRVFASRISTVRGFSTDVVDEISKRVSSVDMLFIDGDHSYEGCRADWLAYKPLLARNAIIVCHDVAWASGVQRVVVEDIRPTVVREKRLPNLWCGWLG